MDDQRTNTFVAMYQQVSRGYMGRIGGFPGVISEGRTLEECRDSLRDALHEMVLAYRDAGETLPTGTLLIEPVAVEA
jgi:predicted RNase H-like HicB family nuclease